MNLNQEVPSSFSGMSAATMNRNSKLVLLVSLIKITLGPAPAYVIFVYSAYSAYGALVFGLCVGLTGLMGLVTMCCIMGEPLPKDLRRIAANQRPQARIRGPAALWYFNRTFVVSLLTAFGVLLQGFSMVLMCVSSKRQYANYKNPAYLVGGIFTMIYAVVLGAVEVLLCWFVSKRLDEYEALNPPKSTAGETITINVHHTGDASASQHNPNVHSCPDPSAHAPHGDHHHGENRKPWPSGPAMNAEEEDNFFDMKDFRIPKDILFGNPGADQPPPYQSTTYSSSSTPGHSTAYSSGNTHVTIVTHHS